MRRKLGGRGGGGGVPGTEQSQGYIWEEWKLISDIYVWAFCNMLHTQADFLDRFQSRDLRAILLLSRTCVTILLTA